MAKTKKNIKEANLKTVHADTCETWLSPTGDAGCAKIEFTLEKNCPSQGLVP